ncbi:SDR family oxidoreductase [candidate division KSB1 bacterium]|nr:SDR family oxidoreductase [candidate division KSB1 bacterium]
MSSFQGKSAIVTGAARGIGRAIAQRFHELGARVFVLDRDYPDSFTSETEGLIPFTGDVSSRIDVEQFVAAVIEQAGGIDILVNNAGILRDNVIWRMSEEEFDAVLNVNLKGAWLMCKTVAQPMRERKYGRIINIASRAWLGNAGQSNYSASKGGLISLTRVLALELARSQVTVNAVAPGLIDTPMTRALPEDTFQMLVNAQPGKRAGTPEDVAAAVCFFASAEAAFITGQTLYVDGGKSIGAATV